MRRHQAQVLPFCIHKIIEFSSRHVHDDSSVIRCGLTSPDYQRKQQPRATNTASPICIRDMHAKCCMHRSIVAKRFGTPTAPGEALPQSLFEHLERTRVAAVKWLDQYLRSIRDRFSGHSRAELPLSPNNSAIIYSQTIALCSPSSAFVISKIERERRMAASTWQGIKRHSEIPLVSHSG